MYKSGMTKISRGFTLIELLIVIAILAVLATASVVVINPAQLLAQARDTQRIQDLASVSSAISLYLTTATTPTLGAQDTSTVNVVCGFSTTPCVVDATRETSGIGWVVVNLDNTSGGSPLATLPTDPSSTATYQYAYVGDNTNKTFQLDARLESTKYAPLMQTDGGADSVCTTWVSEDCYYEVGNDPGLNM
jgi:prepilin-type N-terminal cleavage/methylation domain-containing protein